MKRLASIAILATAAAFCVASAWARNLTFLMSTQTDPSLMTYVVNAKKNVANPCTCFFNGGETNATVMFWIECDRVHWWTGWSGMQSLFFNAFVSLDAARSTKEGGDELTNLLDGAANYEDYDTPLVLTDGAWSATDVLYPTWTVGSRETHAGWPYGAYCVNLVTDSALVLTVGGTDVNVGYAAANGGSVTQAFNVIATDASRSVIVTASSTSARVQLGVARQVPIEFMQCATTHPLKKNGNSQPSNWVTNEWAMLAFRVAVSPTGVVTSHCDLLTWYDHVDCGGCVKTSNFSRASFERNARFVVNAHTLCAALTNDTMNVWGPKGLSGWLDNQQIEQIRDRDVAEMQKRGMSRTWIKSE